jgi:choline dehydrogenase
MEPTTNNNPTNEPEAPEFEARVQATQRRLAAELQSSYDFIVCGSGSSGFVVARRLAETDDVSVLLLEAGGTTCQVSEKRTLLLLRRHLPSGSLRARAGSV